MRGVLEIYDTLRSVRIPAACYAVGKMEANQQGSAFFGARSVDLQREGFVFSLTHTAFVQNSPCTCVHGYNISLPLKLFAFGAR